MNNLPKYCLILILCLFISGCTQPIKEPSISVNDISIQDVSLLKITFKTDITVNNPNSVGATIKTLKFDIFYQKGSESVYIGHGEKNSFEIKGNGITSLTTPVEIINTQTIKALGEFAQSGSVPIKVQGSANVDFTVISFELPFEKIKIISQDDFRGIISSSVSLPMQPPIRSITPTPVIPEKITPTIPSLPPPSLPSFP